MQDPLFDPGTQGQSSSIKAGFNHFNDIFSQFAKYIGPSYHHERVERSIQMRLYTLHKGQHLLIFIMFLCLFFIALLMGMAGPRIITEHTEKGSKLLEKMGDSKDLSVGPFVLMTPKLNNYRQQLWISVEIRTKDNDQATFSKTCKATVTIEGVIDGDRKEPVGLPNVTRTRMLICQKNKCNSFILLHLGALEYCHYLVNVTFDGLKSVDKHLTISDIFFNITTYNPEFTEMEIWFRFFFVLATAVIAFIYLVNMRNFHLDDWSIEQKWTGLLLVQLVSFNNPLFTLTLTSRNLFPALCDVFFQASFIFSLLLFWLCIFHGLRQTERGLWNFYLPKISLVGPMWFSAVVMTSLEEINELKDPSFSYELNSAHYEKFQMAFIILLALYTVYLIYLALRAFGELRSMNFLDARLKFHASSLLIVLCLTMSIVFNRYGSGVLEDNFIARIYTSYNSEHQFLAFYTVLNCYIYVLSYVYAPTLGQSKENHLLRDNPTLSMINESDDETEAMLGPDMKEHEESKSQTQINSRRPLILGHDDDSD